MTLNDASKHFSNCQQHLVDKQAIATILSTHLVVETIIAWSTSIYDWFVWNVGPSHFESEPNMRENVIIHINPGNMELQHPFQACCMDLRCCLDVKVEANQHKQAHAGCCNMHMLLFVCTAQMQLQLFITFAIFACSGARHASFASKKKSL
jgi:hypothetical protein